METSARRSVSLISTFTVLVGCGGAGGPLTIVEPTAGEVLIAGTVQSVRWDRGSGIDKVDIWLNVPGVAEVVVAKGLPNDGDYEWTVPLLPTGSAASGSLHVGSAGTMPAGAKPVVVAAAFGLSVVVVSMALNSAPARPDRVRAAWARQSDGAPACR